MSEDPTYTPVQIDDVIDSSRDPFVVRMRGYAAHGMTPFDVPFISRITDNLFQGGCRTGLVLPHDIRHVVSLYPWESYTTERTLDSYLEVKMYDSVEQGFEQLDELVDWVIRRQETGPVLVHCQAGLNRSSLLMAKVLIKYGFSAVDAIALIREQRSPACLCNPAFEEHLLS